MQFRGKGELFSLKLGDLNSLDIETLVCAFS